MTEERLQPTLTPQLHWSITTWNIESIFPLKTRPGVSKRLVNLQILNVFSFVGHLVFVALFNFAL